MKSSATGPRKRGRPRLPNPEPKTEGQRRLLELEGSEAEIAARVGCKPAVVGHWRRGRRNPGPAHRHKLELLFGVPRRAWDVEPGSELPEPSTSTSASPSAPTTSSPVGDDTLAITVAQIEDVRRELRNEAMTDTASARLRDTLAKLLALRARLERDQEMAEDRAVREHPAWTATKAAILRALGPYPEAAAAVAEALDGGGAR